MWINRLVIGPKVGQTAALRLTNRLGSPLYYCVLENTHRHTNTELSDRVAHVNMEVVCALSAKQKAEAGRQQRYSAV